MPISLNTNTQTPLAGNPSLPPATNLSDASVAPSIDPLGDLYELTWRGIPFPAVLFRESGSQQLAEHKFPNVDAAFYESMGRNPLKLSCKAILTNNVYPSANETWKPGTLFPTVASNLLTDFYNNETSGTLMHPFLGEITCKVLSWDYDLNGKAPRDGIFLDIVWVESFSDNASVSPIIVGGGAGSTLPQCAGALDTLISAVPLATPNFMSLAGAFSQLAAAITQINNLPGTLVQGLNMQLLQITSTAKGVGQALGQIGSSSNSLGAVSTVQNINQGIHNTYQTVISALQGTTSSNGSLITGATVSSQPTFNAVPFNATSSAQASLSPNGSNNNVGYNTGNTYSSNPGTLYALVSAAAALNTNTSSSAINVLENIQTFAVSLLNYYESIGNVVLAPVQWNLTQFLGFVQQQQKMIGSNSGATIGLSVGNFTTTYPTTLLQLAQQFNNTMDQLLQLNSTLTNTYFVLPNTTVNYYQA